MRVGSRGRGGGAYVAQEAEAVAGVPGAEVRWWEPGAVCMGARR